MIIYQTRGAFRGEIEVLGVRTPKPVRFKLWGFISGLLMASTLLLSRTSMAEPDQRFAINKPVHRRPF
jgi:hypothetical protein